MTSEGEKFEIPDERDENGLFSVERVGKWLKDATDAKAKKRDELLESMTDEERAEWVVRDEMRRNLLEADEREREARRLASTPGTPEYRERVVRGRLEAAGVESEDVAELLVLGGLPLPLPNAPEAPENLAVQVVARFVKSPEARSLALLGLPGTGKTVAACYAIAKVGRALMLDATRIEPAPGWNGRKPGEEESLRERALACRLLVIDDLAPDNAWKVREVEEIVCSRHNHQKKTILTANWARTVDGEVRLGLAAGHSLEGAFGARSRLMSRLCEKRRGGIVELGDLDLRGSR